MITKEETLGYGFIVHNILQIRMIDKILGSNYFTKNSGLNTI